jgi:arylsulfatase A-like enzyme
MDRAEFLKSATAGAVGLALATAALARKSETTQAAQPNILLIMTDDQPYHTMSIMESFQNRVVSRGMRFNNGYVTTLVCGPARGSVLTGK